MLLMALSLAALQRAGAKGCTRAGVYMSGAVLLREFFLPMGVIVAIYSIVRGGWSGFLRFALAGAVVATGIVAAIVLLRGQGGFGGLVDAYTGYHTAVAGKSDLNWVLNKSAIAVQVLIPLLPVAAIGLIAPVLGSMHRDRRSLELYLLAVALSLCPLAEAWYKPSEPYHFAQSVFGLTILCAFGLRVLLTALPRWYRSTKPLPLAIGLALVGANLFLLKDYARTFYWQAHSAARFVPLMVGGDWKSDVTDRSFYLRAARAIRENTGPSATLIMDGSSSGLFPLANRRPASVGTGNLGRVLSRRDASLKKSETDHLYEAPPDIFVIIRRQGVYPLDFDEFPKRLATRYSRKIIQSGLIVPYGAGRPRSCCARSPRGRN
jgi:hypothetical protein